MFNKKKIKELEAELKNYKNKHYAEVICADNLIQSNNRLEERVKELNAEIVEHKEKYLSLMEKYDRVLDYIVSKKAEEINQ